MKTILWNGFMGVFEIDRFAFGTEGIAEKVAELSGKGVTTVIGGGDSVAAMEKMGTGKRLGKRRAATMVGETTVRENGDAIYGRLWQGV
ncbi:hypothetical protein SUGI_1023440 [Cryptomeria japonica]|nr:hypothetical protein SUGI_1023440 [Cryptomeria japonica]